MKLCSVVVGSKAAAAVVVGERIVTLIEVGQVAGCALPASLEAALHLEALPAIQEAVVKAGPKLVGRGVATVDARLLAPIRNPPKIWCIGLNYQDHASDLAERSPDEPASFMRPAASIRGPGDPICLPPESQRVTGEAELAVVIGRRCKYVSRSEALSVIAGFLPAIDMTAEDILRRNPRFLTRAKSFDTFLSLGPFLVTPDEVGDMEDVRRLTVSTMLNGQVERTNTGTNMTHDVFELIAFHSRVFTWEAGDILLTGTPGAVVIRPGDIVGCEIAGIGRLENPVTPLPADGVPVSRFSDRAVASRRRSE